MKKLQERVLPVIFSLSILMGLLGRQIATRVTEDYWNTQPEFIGPDMIETVMYDGQLEQLYVCYSDANCVNVYSESGEFRWAVGTPYIRGNQFCLKDGMLVCYGDGEGYCFDAAEGTYLETVDEDDLELPYRSDATDKFRWDSFQVYDAQDNVLVDRPAWYWVFDFMLTWYIAAACALGMGFTRLQDQALEARRASRKAKLTDRRAIRYRAASVAMIAVHLIYGAAVQFHEVLPPWLILGIFPITVHFILAGWIWLDRPARWDIPEEEYAITRFWRAANIASLVAFWVLFFLAYVIF